MKESLAKDLNDTIGGALLIMRKCKDCRFVFFCLASFSTSRVNSKLLKTMFRIIQ